MKKQFNNFVEIERMIKFLQWQETTTKQQKKNGTREFKLPINDPYGAAIHVASTAKGYVRRTRSGGYCDCWQLNKTRKVPPTKDYKWQSVERILILNEQDRLEYLISFCLKNYYIGQANKLSNGEFVPKWKHEAYKEEHGRLCSIVNKLEEPEVKVIVNGHRYNIT